MEGLKAKLNAMREQLAAAEKREELARTRARNERERLARAEDEIAAQKRKKSVLQWQLTRAEDQTDSKLDQLECFQKHIDENAASRRQLERKEMKEDGTLEHLETRHKSRQIFAEQTEQRYREACNKLSMLEAQNAKVCICHRGKECFLSWKYTACAFCRQRIWILILVQNTSKSECIIMTGHF
jgi:chromosome segregation ATPase